jgi:predicted transcriptional regulator
MSVESKPREFELFYSGVANAFFVRENYSAILPYDLEGKDDEYIRVVEKSYADALAAELASLSESYGAANDEIEEIEAQFTESSARADQLYKELQDEHARTAALCELLDEMIKEADSGNWSVTTTWAERAKKIHFRLCGGDE